MAAGVRPPEPHKRPGVSTHLYRQRWTRECRVRNTICSLCTSVRIPL